MHPMRLSQPLPRRVWINAGLFLLLAVNLALLPGCSFFQGDAGNLTLRSQAPSGSTLQGNFTTSIYRFDSANHLTIILLDGPIENPVQALTVRMFWQPSAGKTPIDPTATNATVNYVIFTGSQGQEMGLYSGAGFLFPYDEPGDSSLSLGLWDANLLLTDRTTAFQDLLGPALLSGKFTAQRDDANTQDLIRRLNLLVSQRLQYPRMVAIPQSNAIAGDRKPR